MDMTKIQEVILSKLHAEVKAAKEGVKVAKKALEQAENAQDRVLDTIYDRLFKGVEQLKDTPEGETIVVNVLHYDITWLAAERVRKDALEALEIAEELLAYTQDDLKEYKYKMVYTDI